MRTYSLDDVSCRTPELLHPFVFFQRANDYSMPVVDSLLCVTHKFTPWAIKRSQLIFVYDYDFVKKSTDFNAVFTSVIFRNEWHMWRYELYPPYLINVATLPCESQNTENVGLILHREITKKLHQTYNNYIKVDLQSSCALNLLIWRVIQQCVYETIRGVVVLRKCLMQTWFDLTSDIIHATIDQWRDRLRSCVCVCWWWALWTQCSETNVHLYN